MAVPFHQLRQDDAALALEKLAARIRRGEVFVERYNLTHTQEKQWGDLDRKTIGVDLQLVDLRTC
ncbi:MAG: hypothetical protein ACPGSE_00240 [Synechococcus sp.]